MNYMAQKTQKNKKGTVLGNKSVIKVIFFSCLTLIIVVIIAILLFFTNKSFKKLVYKVFIPQYEYSQDNYTEVSIFENNSFSFEYPKDWTVKFYDYSSAYSVKSSDSNLRVTIFVSDNPQYKSSFEEFLSEKSFLGVDFSSQVIQRWQTMIGHEEAWGVLSRTNNAHFAGGGSSQVPLLGPSQVTSKEFYMYHEDTSYYFEVLGSDEEIEQSKCALNTILKSFKFES